MGRHVHRHLNALKAGIFGWLVLKCIEFVGFLRIGTAGIARLSLAPCRRGFLATRHDALKCRIPSILNGIIRSAGKTFRNLRPFISELSVSINDGLILLLSPFTLVDVRIQVVVPTLTALLTESPLELASNEGPFLVPMDLDQPHHCGVFLRRPWPFDEARFEDFLPSMQTLNIASAGKSISNLLPVLPRVGVHGLPEYLIFVLRPFPHGSSPLP